MRPHYAIIFHTSSDGLSDLVFSLHSSLIFVVNMSTSVLYRVALIVVRGWMGRQDSGVIYCKAAIMYLTPSCYHPVTIF